MIEMNNYNFKNSKLKNDTVVLDKFGKFVKPDKPVLDRFGKLVKPK